MIKEFAVEPAAIVGSYADFRYIIEKFGVWEGRVISKFPKRWLRLVYEAAAVRHRGTVECARIEERLRRLPDGLLMSLARPGGDGEQPWLDIALAEHKRKPFDFLLTSEAHEGIPAVPVVAFEGEHHSLKITREVKIVRQPKAMADACDLLLRTSNHVKFIDPHFDFGQPRYRQPFRAFVERMQPGTLVEIYRTDKISAEELLRCANMYMPAALRDGITVRLIVWTSGLMHNRYIVTNVGGAKFGVGLDSAKLNAAQEDEVSLMVPDVWRACWTQYTGGKALGEWRG